MRKQMRVYKKHATRKFQQFWDVKHKTYSCLSYVQFEAKSPHFQVLVIDSEGRDITEETLKEGLK